MENHSIKLNPGFIIKEQVVNNKSPDHSVIELSGPNTPGSITFILQDYGEIVKFEPNGDVYVKGKLTTNDIEVVNGIKEFLSLTEKYNSNWKDTAAQMCRNAEYYRGLVEQIGNMFGKDAYISDDGSVQQDVLCAKVPELVAKMLCVNLEE